MTASSRLPSKLLLATLILSFISLTALTSRADTPPPAPQHSADSADQNMSDMDGMEKHSSMAKELKLNDKQRESFKSAMMQMHESMKSERDMHEQLRSLIESDDYSDKKIHEIIQKHSTEQESNAAKGAKAMHDFYASLSPEQKTTFKAMQDKMKEHMKDHAKDHTKGHANI